MPDCLFDACRTATAVATAPGSMAPGGRLSNVFVWLAGPRAVLLVIGIGMRGVYNTPGPLGRMAACPPLLLPGCNVHKVSNILP